MKPDTNWTLDMVHALLDAARRKVEAADFPGRRALGARVQDMRVHVGYGEPGYGEGEDDETVVVLGNWNPVDTRDKGDGIAYAIVRDDGTSEMHDVSPEDFVACKLPGKE